MALELISKGNLFKNKEKEAKVAEQKSVSNIFCGR